MTGRPTLYTPEVADKILDLLAQGQTLKKVCRDDEELPHESTVRLWAAQDREGFKQRYLDAREIGYLCMFDEMLEIADTPVIGQKTKTTQDGKVETTTGDMIEHRRLQVDTRKWALSKALPKVFGDRLDLNAKHDVSDGVAELLKAIDGKTKGLPNKETTE